MKNMIPGLSLPYRTKCVDKNPPPPEKVYPGNRLRLPSPHRDTPASSADACTQEVPGLQMFLYAFLLRKK